MTDPRKLQDRGLARDVASHLDRGRRRRRLFGWAFVATVIVLAIFYLTCGRGWGVGGKGAGKGAGEGSVVPVVVDAGPVRCAVRVTAAGLTVDGRAATRDEVIATCKPTTGAEVLITGDARQGDWDELRAALDAAGIVYLTREPRGVPPTP